MTNFHILSSSKSSRYFLTALDTRIGYATLDTFDHATMALRCPDFMEISDISEACVGKANVQSESVKREVQAACLGRQACTVSFDSPTFLEAFLAECEDMTQCEMVTVMINCTGMRLFFLIRYSYDSIERFQRRQIFQRMVISNLAFG